MSDTNFVAKPLLFNWVDATPFRAHAKHLLRDSNLPWRVIALAAGIPSEVMHSLIFGRHTGSIRRIRAVDGLALISLTAERLTSLGARRCFASDVPHAIAALNARGIKRHTIALFAGLRRAELASLTNGSATTCTNLARWRLLAAAEAWGIDLDELRKLSEETTQDSLIAMQELTAA